MHLAITQSVIKKYPYYKQTYRYIDATAGKGYTPDGKISGSPIVFFNSIKSGKFQIPYVADLIECEDLNFSDLVVNVQEYHKQNSLDSGNVHFYHGRYEDIVPNLLQTVNKVELGLAFVDPSGNLPNFEVLHYITQMRPRMEILIYLSATNIKRLNHQTKKSLLDYMVETGKKHWLIRKPFSWDRHKWTFLLGTNSGIFKDYKKINFFRLDSDEAQQFFPKLNLTAKQRMEQVQPKLPTFQS